MSTNYNPNNIEKWDLDKDIVCRECRIYSPETCHFVPKEINILFNKRGQLRGEYPIGVSLHRQSSKFKSRMGKVYLGLFDTPEEAFQAYKTAKEKYIKEVAEKWKNQISPKIYQAMYEYQVLITD